jgi:hypothetical protein
LPSEATPKHSSQAIGKKKLPSFIIQNTIAAIAKLTQWQDSATPQFTKQTLHYEQKGINTKRRRLFETALNDWRDVQRDSGSGFQSAT